MAPRRACMTPVPGTGRPWTALGPAKSPAANVRATVRKWSRIARTPAVSWTPCTTSTGPPSRSAPKRYDDVYWSTPMTRAPRSCSASKAVSRAATRGRCAGWSCDCAALARGARMEAASATSTGKERMEGLGVKVVPTAGDRRRYLDGVARAAQEPKSHRPVVDPSELRRLPMFADASEAARRALAARAVLRRYDAGDTIFTAGAGGHGLSVVVDGPLRVLRQSGARRY